MTMEIVETFADYGIKIPYRRIHGNVKTVCPKCRTSGRTHPEDRSLSVNLDAAIWNCHYCGWSGGLKGYDRSKISWKGKKEYTRPNPIEEHGLSQKLINYWAQRGISLDTLKKMHIAEGVEFMPQVGKEMNTVQFPYYLDGELVNIKYRTGDKKFKMVQGAELIPYNIDSIKDCDTAYLCEGEADALSFIEAGIDNVISVPNGANKNLEWLDDFMEWFDDKKTIYIAVDNDEKGVMLRDELVRRFGADRCMVVKWSDGCKDANDQLKKYGKESLRNCVEVAQDVKVGGIFYLEDYEKNLDNLYHNGAPKGCTVGWANFDELISFTTKRVMIVTGIPSHGKSAVMIEIAIRLNLRYGWKAAFFSPESMPMESHAQELIQVLVGKSFNPNFLHMSEIEFQMGKDYVRKNFFHIMPEDNQTIATILEKAQFLVRRRGIKMLVIDPYSSIDSDFGNQSETNYIRAMLEALRNFAIRNDLLVCLVAHPTKIRKDKDHDGIPTMYDVSGSAHFLNKTDYGIVVYRDFDNDYTLIKVEKVKSRFLGHKGEAFFKFNINNGRYTPWGKDLPVSWDNTNWLLPEDKQQPESEPSPQENTVESNYDFWSEPGDDCPF